MKELLMKIPNREFPFISNFNMSRFFDLYKIKKYEILFAEWMNETEWENEDSLSSPFIIRVLIPKNDLVLFPELKKYSEYFQEYIKYNYSKKLINNKIPLDLLINNFEFSIGLMYYPFKKGIDKKSQRTDSVMFSIEYGSLYDSLFDSDTPEKDEDLLLGEAFEYISDSFTEQFNYKNEAYWNIKGYDNYVFFEKMVNRLYFNDKKMTMFESLSERYGNQLFEEKKQEAYHLKRLHRQVLFDAYEEMISKNNK